MERLWVWKRRDELWKTLYENGSEEYMVNGVKNLYDGYRACVKWGSVKGEFLVV